MKTAFNKIEGHLREATILAKEYGFTHGVYYVASKVTKGSLNKKIIKKRMEHIYNYISDNYVQRISDKISRTEAPDDLRCVAAFPETLIGKCPIWIYWEQGIENAPELVKMCFNSVIQNTGGVYRHPIVFRKFRAVYTPSQLYFGET